MLAVLVKEKNIDTIWVCHAQMAKYATELKKQYPYLKIFLREHNIEYKLVKQYIKSQKNIFMKLISTYEYLKTKKYEISLWDKFDKVFFISDTDINTAKKYNKNVDDSNLIYDGMDFYEIEEGIEVEEDSFIFTGSFTSFQNENNLKYFIKNIWLPFVQKVPGVKLYLTGNNDNVLISKLNITREDLEKNNIINLGFVDDIKKTILSKQYVISPTLYGSGIRLKVLEALSLRKVVFVSDIDFKMASCFKDMENVVHYSDYDSFYQKYIKIKRENTYQQIADNGYQLINQYFNWDKYYSKAIKIIKQGANVSTI